MQHKTIPEMQAEIRQLREALQIPGVPDDEKQIYTATIRRIEAQIAAMRSAPVTPAPTPPPAEPIKHTTPPPPQTIEQAFERDAARTNTYYQHQADQTLKPSNHQTIKPSTIHAGNQHPVNSKQPMSATIQADHHTNPHNPTVTITWADGYIYTGDETAIRGRFTTTLRDTLALRLVQQGRFNAMWRWSSPWRAAGFYQALTYLIGAAPTIHELGISRPSELTRTVFQLIAETAACTPLTE